MKPAQAVSTLKAGTPMQPRRFCSSTPQLGKIQVRRRGAKGDEIHVLGRDPGRRERAPRGMLGQIHGGLPVGGNVAALDAGAGADPLIGGVEQLLEIVIAHDASPAGRHRCR